MPTPKDVYDFFLFKLNLKQRLEFLVSKENQFSDIHNTTIVIDNFWQEYNRIIVHYTIFSEDSRILVRDTMKLDIADICEGWTDD